MAFEKAVELRNGATGNYHRIHWVENLPLQKACKAHIALYRDASRRLEFEAEPLKEIFARIHIYGPAWEQYLGPEALALRLAESPTSNPLYAQLYLAAREASNSTFNLGHELWCDFGANFYVTALDVV